MARRRNRGGPDRLNALLNFLYFLLYVRISGLIRLLGLNPYLGWLHDTEEDYETLVYDMMEPFRPFVDRLCLRIINRRELRATHFDDTTGQFRLVPAAARLVFESFEKAMGERVQGIPLRELLWHQLRTLRALASAKGSLWLFRWDLHKDLTAPPEPQWLTINETG
nr:CRISPR-associated endonuclease Cas1 [uncultured Undibacterium sp.]